MSFAGHVVDMINRVKYNESLKKGIRSKHSRVKEEYIKKISSDGYNSLKYKELTPEELRHLKSRIKAEIIIQNRNYIIKTTIILLFSLFLVISLGYYLFY
ncbi:MAG: hypothetical protein KGZ97_10935 [Bacteroidetes bacterium]|nr:hypothetical protein [Bacteroidota bacterium]